MSGLAADFSGTCYKATTAIKQNINWRTLLNKIYC